MYDLNGLLKNFQVELNGCVLKENYEIKWKKKTHTQKENRKHIAKLKLQKKKKNDGLFANHVIGCHLKEERRQTSFTFNLTVKVVTSNCYNFESITAAFDNMKLTTIHFIYVKISLLISLLYWEHLLGFSLSIYIYRYRWCLDTFVKCEGRSSSSSSSFSRRRRRRRRRLPETGVFISHSK